MLSSFWIGLRLKIVYNCVRMIETILRAVCMNRELKPSNLATRSDTVQV